VILALHLRQEAELDLEDAAFGMKNRILAWATSSSMKPCPFYRR
jgi:hypothetical protein